MSNRDPYSDSMLMQRKCHTPARKSRVVNGGIDPRQRAMSFD
jgi:hypothetical protein